MDLVVCLFWLLVIVVGGLLVVLVFMRALHFVFYAGLGWMLLFVCFVCVCLFCDSVWILVDWL